MGTVSWVSLSVAASTGVSPALAPMWAGSVLRAGTHGPACAFGIEWGHSNSLVKSTWRMNGQMLVLATSVPHFGDLCSC